VANWVFALNTDALSNQIRVRWCRDQEPAFFVSLFHQNLLIRMLTLQSLLNLKLDRFINNGVY